MFAVVLLVPSKILPPCHSYISHGPTNRVSFLSMLCNVVCAILLFTSSLAILSLPYTEDTPLPFLVWFSLLRIYFSGIHIISARLVLSHSLPSNISVTPITTLLQLTSCQRIAQHQRNPLHRVQSLAACSTLLVIYRIRHANNDYQACYLLVTRNTFTTNFIMIILRTRLYTTV